MSIASTALEILQQEGYRSQSGPGGVTTFRYYGQPAALHVQPFGSGAIIELDCLLPRPAPELADAAAFEQRHALSRIVNVNGQAQLRVQTMMSEADVAAQFRTLLQLLDTYAAAYVFRPDVFSGAGLKPVELEVAVTAAEPEAALTAQRMDGLPSQSQPASAPTSAAYPGETPQAVAPGSAEIPGGWEGVWDLLNVRFHPLALALAALQVPVPDEVQMDMMHGRQVKGTAIMMWGSPPDAVVVCEQGQTVPHGYRGGTWLRHQTAEQVAQETRAYLQAVGRA